MLGLRHIKNQGLWAFLGLALVCWGSLPAKAQQPTSKTVDNIIETILEQKDQALDYTDLVRSLNRYYENPLSLNTATREELLSLHVLSVPQINEILAYRDQYQGFTTIYELKAIPRLDRQTIEQLRPFVNTDRPEDRLAITPENMVKYGGHDLFLRANRTLEEVKGQRIADTASSRENNQGYLGSPIDHYLRYTYNFQNRISFGVTAEKDAGEEFFAGSQSQGYDYYSTHLFLQDIGNFESIALGDYEAEFGQGLILSSGLALNKTPGGISISKNLNGLDAYTSANENNFFRGAGATYQLADQTKLTAFYSRKATDANISTGDTSQQARRVVSSITGSGMHRTRRELADKDALRQQAAGGHVQQNFSNLTLGATGLWINNGKPVQTSDRLYDRYGWSGREAWNLGVDYQWLFRDFYFFGEVGYSHTGAMATLNGMLLNLPSGFKLGAIYRNYPKNFVAPFANAFRESGQVRNEEGVFLTTEFSPFDDWKVTGYFDHFQFPWLQFQTDRPSSGYEYASTLTYDPGSFTMYGRLTGERGIRNRPSDASAEAIGRTNPYRQWRLRWNLEFRANTHWSFQSRVSRTFYQREGSSPEKGWMAFQDAKYETQSGDFYVVGRYGLFAIDDYRARIFTYENDLLYTFSIPFFQDRGMRCYVLGRLNAFGNMSFWLKLGQTRYFNRSTVGSGYQQIQGNTETTVKAQVRWQF
jgi:hypothetical protein